MNALIRPARVLAAALLLVPGFCGLRFACDPSFLRELVQAELRREQLNQLHRSSLHHHEAKEHVVREVIVQRCSLSQALARLEELDREWLRELGHRWPDTALGILFAYQLTLSDADFRYRGIFERVADLLKDQPHEADSVLRRLGQEHEQLRTCRQTSGCPDKTDRTKSLNGKQDR